MDDVPALTAGLVHELESGEVVLSRNSDEARADVGRDVDGVASGARVDRGTCKRDDEEAALGVIDVPEAYLAAALNAVSCRGIVWNASDGSRNDSTMSRASGRSRLNNAVASPPSRSGPSGHVPRQARCMSSACRLLLLLRGKALGRRTLSREDLS